MSDVMNPVSIEQSIRGVSNRIAESVETCNEAYKTFLTADHSYDIAYAQAYLNASDRPAHERRYIAERDTQEQRQNRNVADAAYRYADRQAKALDAELRAWQSVGASVRAMYGVAGTGER